MRFIEDTVVRIPERVIQIATAQLRLNDARAAIAKSCALRAPKLAEEALHKSIMKPLISPTCDHYRATRVLHETLLKTV